MQLAPPPPPGDPPSWLGLADSDDDEGEALGGVAGLADSDEDDSDGDSDGSDDAEAYQPPSISPDDGGPPPPPPGNPPGYAPSPPATFWSAFRERLPCGKDEASKRARSDLFASWDMNGNRYLSVAEVERGVRATLGDVLEQIDTGVVDAQRVILRAFEKAKGASPDQSRLGNDFVSQREFRLLLLYLRNYYELHQAFERLDTNQDQQISRQEFVSKLPLLAKWGITVARADADREFDAIDVNGGGVLLFDEFCAW